MKISVYITSYNQKALLSEAIKMCQRAETIIYTISTNVGPSKDKGDDVLREIADATGGQSFFPSRMEDVAVGFRNVEEFFALLRQV